MRQTLPGISFWTVGAALQCLAGNNSAISSEACEVKKVTASIVQFSDSAQSLFGEKAAAISRLIALANECSEEGWDGEGAYAIDAETMSIAKHLIRILPPGVPLPEFAPEPDGSISVDWTQSKDRNFSLSINRHNRFAFSWVDGVDSGYGVITFNGHIVPKRVLEGINGVLNYGNPSIRAA